MNLNFSMNVIAADTGKREITGRVVTWGEEGYTSAGPTIFAKDSLKFNKTTKLLLEHDRTRPIGKLVAYELNAEGIDATFKVADTVSGSDALVEASTGLRDGFSVGVKVEKWSNNDGVMEISAARVHEISLVTDPAIDSARVADVAASAEDNIVPSEADVNNKNSEAPVSEKTENEGEIVDNTTDSAPIANEAVEASEAPKVVASTPVAYSTPRVNTDVTAGQFAKAQLAATRGDADARDLVAALQVATVAENTGAVPPTYLRDVIGIIDASRPFINSIETAPLPASGMKIFTPKLGNQAIVALTAEGAEFASQDTSVTFQEDNVVKFAGAGILDVELVDRSDPAFLDLYIRELAASYAQKTDAYAAKIAADGSSDSSAASIYKAIVKGIADSYNVMRMTPDNLLVAPTGGYDGIDFAGLLGEVDDVKRPLFAAAAPSNAAGLVTQGSTNGTVAGLSLVVDPNYAGGTSGNKVGLVYPRSAMRFHEGANIQLRTNVVSNGQLEIGLYGYCAVVNRYPSAFRNVQVA